MVYAQNNRPIAATRSSLVIYGCRLVHALYAKDLIVILENLNRVVKLYAELICIVLFECEHIRVGKFEITRGSKGTHSIDFSFPPGLSIALFLERSYN